MAYATVDDLAEFLGLDDPPTWATEAKMARASETVDTYLIAAVYDVDEDSLPTDTAEAAAIKRATCAQANYTQGVGDDSGALGRFQSFSIGSISATLRSGANGSASATGRESQEAIDILRVAGLIPVNVYSNWGR